MRASFLAVIAGILLAAGYVGLALACLYQRGTPVPWSHVDAFSGGFLALMAVAIPVDLAAGLGRAVLRSPQILREASGMTYDPATLVLLGFLGAGDMLVFLDYGHWHLVPSLVHPGPQVLGLALAASASAWLVWVDARLARHFTTAPVARIMIEDGPFRYVRHPRYAGLLATRIALALALASLAGWLLALVWSLVLLRRIRLEERHLEAVFGAAYDVYAQRTARLIPGVY